MTKDINLLKNQTIAFIGGGNMASSLIGGLIRSGIAAGNIRVSDPNGNTRKALGKQFGVAHYEDNAQAIDGSDVVVLAVKPQIMRSVCETIKPVITASTLLISIAAGITSLSFSQWLGSEKALVRVMPNTPALVGLGASGMFANHMTSAQQMQIAEAIMSSVGIAHWVKNEQLIDVVTAVSGSGPAYFFLLMESMIKSAMTMGLHRDIAEALAIETAIGAGQLAKNSTESVSQLRRKVTSPNGTTERAIFSMQENNFADIIKDAMQACADRADELGKELDN